jgi:hypothetical protein
VRKQLDKDEGMTHKQHQQEAYVSLISDGQPNDSQVASSLFNGSSTWELAMAVYHFDTGDAEEFGIDGAIILYNMSFWIAKNKANKMNFHDGRYWTYNSARAFVELFPFWNSQKIGRVLRKLEVDGAIISGNYNKVGYDKTKWYSVLKSRCLNINNGAFNSEQPIPDSNPDSKQHISTEDKPPVEEGRESSDKKLKPIEEEKNSSSTNVALVAAYNALGLKQMIKLTPARKTHLNARIKEWSYDQVMEVFTKTKRSSFLMGENPRGWKADFDWLMNPNNFVKVIEGNYDGGSSKDDSDQGYTKEIK